MGSKRNCDSLKLKILKPILKQIRGRVDCLYEILWEILIGLSSVNDRGIADEQSCHWPEIYTKLQMVQTIRWMLVSSLGWFG